MSNQQTRILAATQLRQEKKRHLALLSRATQNQTNFNHEQERLTAIASQHQELIRQQTMLIRMNQKPSNQTTPQERLITAHSLSADKHRNQSAIARSIPKTDELDPAYYWWITPSINFSNQKLSSKPSYKPLKSLVDIL